VNPGYLVVGIIALLLVISWIARPRPERESPDQVWQPTEEVFRDVSTNRTMRVWIDPRDGSRHNVPERGMR
jgi:hypothetical protein